MINSLGNSVPVLWLCTVFLLIHWQTVVADSFKEGGRRDTRQAAENPHNAANVDGPNLNQNQPIQQQGGAQHDQNNVPVLNQHQNQQQANIVPQRQQQQYVNQAGNQAVPQRGYQQAHQALPGPHLALMKECAADVEKYCPKVKKENDIAVLECLEDLGEDEVEILSGDCEHLVWQFKKNFTQDERFHRAAAQFCKQELEVHLDCKNQNQPGHLLGCLLEYKENMTHGQCRNFLSRTERIAFSDFRLVGSFVEKCTGDVERFKCGSLLFSKDVNPQDRIHHSQGSTLQCLIEKLVEQAGNAKHQNPQLTKDASLALDPQCRHEVLRLAELQSDDYHLDRPLFFACRNDRERLCRDIQGGEGRVYNCLLQRKDDSDMSADCKHQLIVRAQLIAQDYKVSHSLVQSCQRNIQQYQCMPQADRQTPEHFYLSFIVLCLENAVHSSRPIEPACQQQLFEHRKLMMSDYRISPEVVLSCTDDIRAYCGDRVEGGGATLHCLMGVESGVSQRRQGKQEQQQRLSAQCKQAITHLIKAADPGSDYRVDMALYRSCKGLIEGQCSQAGGSESDVLTCLMNHVETQDMTMECEDRLLEIQYFMSRDFVLDPKLYKACHRDAVAHCSAPENWHMEPKETNQPDPGPQILACLYRNAYNASQAAQLSRSCRSEVIRTLRERAVSVHLMPQIEEYCRMALAAKCSQATRPGQELKCLQEHMEDEDFKQDYPDCKAKIEEFTVEESKDIKLNRALSRACRPVIEEHCKELLEEEIDHGDVMECLQANKGAREMNSKCRSYVNFYTLVSMKDYKFSYKFKKACSDDVKKYCKDISTNDKTELMRCLGEVMVNHQVLGETDGLGKECKRQLRNDFLQLENVEKGPDENEHMQSGFWKICKEDIINNKCYGEGRAAHEVMECLKKRQIEEDVQLTGNCKRLLFGMEQIEMVDNRMDAELQEKCALELKEFCAKVDPERVLRCLYKNIRQPGMGESCARKVNRRMHEQEEDIRLNPGLLRTCRADLKALCEKEFNQIREQLKVGVEEEVLEGHAVYCLRMKMTDKDPKVRARLHPDCETELKNVILDSEIDPKMDPVFYKHCKSDIHKFCTNELVSAGGHGTIMECIKSAYYKHQMQDNMCKTEIARRTSEELSDIHLDPVLHEACALDIKHYCHDTPPGEGRIVSCLLMASDSTNAQLTPPCMSKLNDRKKLWDMARGSEFYIPDSIGGFGQLLMDSPARNSVFTIFLVIVLIIFVGGLCFGRVTKKVRQEVKNK